MAAFFIVRHGLDWCESKKCKAYKVIDQLWIAISAKISPTEQPRIPENQEATVMFAIPWGDGEYFINIFIKIILNGMGSAYTNK